MRSRRASCALAPGAAVWLFGHAGDGNVHVNVTGVALDDERVTEAVFALVAALHGFDQRRARDRCREARLPAPRAQ